METSKILYFRFGGLRPGPQVPLHSLNSLLFCAVNFTIFIKSPPFSTCIPIYYLLTAFGRFKKIFWLDELNFRSSGKTRLPK